MKKLFFILLIIFFAGCEKDEIQKEPEVIKDCHCDRIITVNSSNLPNGQKIWFWESKNDCTGEFKKGTLTYTKPILGTCKR